MSYHNLSVNHPLHTDPLRPWPYKVLIGYRAMGNRKIVATRSVYVRASGESQARLVGLREARAMIPMLKDGKRLKASRIVSSRPLDKCDAGLVA
ncbi:hypothetical protein [Marinobacter salarius]|uniref:hypothetical protein n=1 Tax=Marinobacter salarius TaxID=1420917 RepID=UPI00241EAD3C|nr:hypothetical protein [Marinobacter salarius]